MKVFDFVKLTREQYDNLVVKDPYTFYQIIDGDIPDEYTIVAIEVNTPPDKQFFHKGEPIDYTGMTIFLKYDHVNPYGTIGDIVPYTQCDFSIPQGTILDENTPNPVHIWWPQEDVVDPPGHSFETIWYFNYSE